MNFAIIFHILGFVLNIEAALMAFPVIAGLFYKESAITAFLITMVICLVIGIPLSLFKPKDTVFYVREGFVTVALCWIVKYYGLTAFSVFRRNYASARCNF